ncbi:MAG: hypothetical protein AABX54_03860 [Nanoarchaeota archaeon]
MDERKTEEFENDQKKWKIYFDIEIDHLKGKNDSSVFVNFVLNRKKYPLVKEDIEELKQDLRDIGKFRIIKQSKEFLEE